MALKKQNSDLIDHLGCPDKEGASWMCIELFIEEKSLQLQVLTEMLRGQEEMAEGERECGGSGDAGGG